MQPFDFIDAIDSSEKAVHDESNWLVSYADMMTLLCGFFIMLYTMANLDQKKYEAVAAVLSKQFGGKTENPLQTLLYSIQLGIKNEQTKLPFEITADTYGILIVFQSTLFFRTLSAEIFPDGQIALAKLAKVIMQAQKDKKKNFRIIIEGHSDSRPIVSGNFASNWELSAARAATVVRNFLDQGFIAKQLAAVGYADTHPIVQDHNPDGTLNESNLAKNRRVVIRILDPAFHGMSTQHPPSIDLPEHLEKDKVAIDYKK